MGTDSPNLHLHTADRMIRQVRINVQTDAPAVIAGVNSFLRLWIADAPNRDAENALEELPTDLRVFHQSSEEVIVLDGDVLQSFQQRIRLSG